MRSVMLRRPDLSAVLRRVAVPSLLIAAAAGSAVAPRQAQAARGGQTAATVPAGHLPPLAARAEVTRLLLDLWQSG